MAHTTNEFGDDASLEALAESDRHRLLMAERRRLALDVLAVRDGPIALADLGREVAARENVDAFDEDAVTLVTLSLHHVHLPKMATYGVIDYDRERNRIESCPDGDRLGA